MKFKLKASVLEQLLSDYEARLTSMSTNPPMLALEINENKTVSALYPYIFNYFIQNTARSLSDFFMDEDGDPVVKFKQDENNFLLELREPWEQSLAHVQKRYNYRVQYFFSSIKDQGLPIIEGAVAGQYIITDSIHFPLDWFEVTEDEVVEAKVMSLSQWRAIAHKNPQISKIKYYDSPSYFLRDDNIEVYFIVLLKNQLVIGLSECVVHKDKQIIVSKYSSIIPEEQGKGYSEKILEAKVKFAAQRWISLENSSYSHSGFYRIRPKVLALCEQHNVPLIEGGLHNRAVTVPEEIFRVQTELKKELLRAKNYKQNSVYINSTQIDLKVYKTQIEKFLSLNPYEYDTEEKVEDNLTLLTKFVSRDLIKRILAKEFKD